jgi:hypothetical protein
MVYMFYCHAQYHNTSSSSLNKSFLHSIRNASSSPSGYDIHRFYNNLRVISILKGELITEIME